ncbi:16S rRNA (cytidine(1402)-2'-O)-methyltransferase [Candidatus Kuenenbacteria bacterium CG10_big_fil_rev_8_21_14_0_10_36_11]|uniref:Ribosomal RNA small subunit methyltransferase I n=1 Tax=Candidatus Kuenenbacteria bacterium CG10_big_fil_rev_8_21_14_0_10_36_11 TaxID=1974618 RepID=A0A2M6WAZ7_9BACT|nr:MAG: 16S rRNA (cytidine(1402)-2'-O)-methyltransferase [Candidatus Kuenenbacteria bacterium CG10_big_fil_rev_8_21_14_0_10_36_11]
MLYIIATPIGNLEDITLRVLRVLKEADYILCEDTRVTRKLLDHYKIENKKLVVYHHHSNERKIQEIIELIKNNQVALVTDAGTPGISDPGNKLINFLVGAIHELPLQIVPIPGACALITALSISGLPTDKFIFKGFVPHKKGRETFLCEVLAAKETVVFYESCHRIMKCLEQLNKKYCHSRENGNPGDNENEPGLYPWDPRFREDDRKKRRDDKGQKYLVVCRELTKKFETIYRGTAEEILKELKNEFKDNEPKGEFVIVVG